MDNNVLLSRRKVLAGSVASFVGIILPFSALASDAISSGAQKADYPQSARRLQKPLSIKVQIDSIDPQFALRSTPERLNVVPGEVMSVQQSANIPAPYYFDVNADWTDASQSNLNLTINLYDIAGDELSSITTRNNGTAIFKEQKIKFRVSTASGQAAAQ
ncbi:hypothetical protein [Xanthomonas graminis]|uniref:hypothetical protein n=1 Tax=Xanthomonas graminis TaxID=3390026 RepID=UPI000A681D93|nr:hypothetical protein [Xanthomonas translucens]